MVTEPPFVAGTVTVVERVDPKVVPADTDETTSRSVPELDPAQTSSVYVDKSAIDGASPLSAQVTVKAVPAFCIAAAAGAENVGYAIAKGTNAKCAKAWERRIMNLVHSRRFCIDVFW